MCAFPRSAILWSLEGETTVKHAISRRHFLATGAVVTTAGLLPANPLGLPIGSQTYPHRQRITDGDFA